MAKVLDQILEQRRRREGPAERRRSALVSLVTHSLLVAAAWFVPELWAKPTKPFEYVTVNVVPPSILGEEVPTPPPPPPPTVEPPPPEPPPVEEPPPPEPEPEAPVLVKEPVQTEVKPPPPKQVTPPPPVRRPPPKRQGSAFGTSLGASHRNTTIGVEDPNFTYGYYLDRVVASISGHWNRPLADPEIVQSTFYFRILQDGRLSELRLVDSSGSDAFDQTAEAAVRAAVPFPPLPKQYTKKYGRDYLGIHLIIK